MGRTEPIALAYAAARTLVLGARLEMRSCR